MKGWVTLCLLWWMYYYPIMYSHEMNGSRAQVTWASDVLILTHKSGPKGVVNRCTSKLVWNPGKRINLINNDWIKISRDKDNWLKIRKKGEREEWIHWWDLCFRSLPVPTFKPPKQQFFNCAIVEITLPSCLARLPRLRDVSWSSQLHVPVCDPVSPERVADSLSFSTELASATS